MRYIRVIPPNSPGEVGVLENDSTPVILGGMPIYRKRIYSTSKKELNLNRYSPSIKKSTGKLKVHIHFNIH